MKGSKSVSLSDRRDMYLFMGPLPLIKKALDSRLRDHNLILIPKEPLHLVKILGRSKIQEFEETL